MPGDMPVSVQEQTDKRVLYLGVVWIIICTVVGLMMYVMVKPKTVVKVQKPMQEVPVEKSPLDGKEPNTNTIVKVEINDGSKTTVTVPVIKK